MGTPATTSKKSSAQTPKGYRCNICGRTFNSPEELSSHQKLEHSESGQPPAGVS
jgi:tRNA(Ile2) C34 agmatinyltransferase TiaS